MHSTNIKIYGQATQNDLKFDEACTAFFNWRDSVAESAEEYSDRIKRLKLLKIFKSIIENELTGQQKELITLSYLENKSGEEIAALYGVSRSTVCRKLVKITELFTSKMKYVFEYADIDVRNEAVPAYIEQALAVMSTKATESEKAGERLKKARMKKLLSISVVSQTTGVPQKKIENFESGGTIGFDEFVRLISFYKVSADEVIFGV